MSTIDGLDWQHHALCAALVPEPWFPEQGETARIARRICAHCEVRADCLAYALAHDIRQGIWGGTTYLQRRRLGDRG